MNTYRVMPSDYKSYVVKADYVETLGEWLMFRTWSDEDADHIIVHICSARFTCYVDLVTG